MRILLAEHDHDVAADLRDLLHEFDAEITATSDSSSVEKLVHELHPDLVLLDLALAAPDGLEILTRLRPLVRGPYAMPVIALTETSERDARGLAVAAGARDFLTKPLDGDEVRLRVRNLLDLRGMQMGLRRHADELEVRERKRIVELESARIEVLQRLARAGEFRDDETGEHTRRVGRTTATLARAAGLDESVARALEVAAPLHDIGKIAIPDTILLRRGGLTSEQSRVMRGHTVIGAQILDRSSSQLLLLARDIALSHHERWDGGGYPYGLRGENIPIGGRLVAIADVFDALTHERPYKAAWTVPEAVAEIVGERGSQFDPHLVEAFATLDHETLV